MDWESDAAELLRNPPEPTEEEKQAAEKKKSKRDLHPVDKQFDLRKTSKVYAEDLGNVYDVTLTKVDVRFGLDGINNFYKMQVIYNQVKDLYILWNRLLSLLTIWGN